MVPWSEVRSGKSRITCPGCGKSKSDKTCGVLNTPEKGIAHCFRCGLISHRDGEYEAGEYVEDGKRFDTLAPWAQKWWDQSEPIHSVGSSYLKARSCVLPPRDGDLRYHFGLKHSPSKYIGPALIALITDPLTAKPLSLHRTWICADGKKATKPGRMYLGRHAARGVCRLWPDEAVQGGLGIAEGIESALSLAHAFTPVWACLDAGNMYHFPVLPGVESLTIAADNDEAGIRAAEACARRWKAAGREVRVVMGENEKEDLNDLAVAA